MAPGVVGSLSEMMVVSCHVFKSLLVNTSSAGSLASSWESFMAPA